MPLITPCYLFTDMTKAVVLDLDGTLIDSIPDVCVAVNRTLQSNGRGPISLPEIRKIVGEGVQVMLEKAFALKGELFDDGMVNDVMSQYLAFYKERPAELTTIYPGVREVLDYFATKAWPIGICTNKPGEMTGIVLDALEISHYFSAVTAGDNVPYRKPDGRHIHLTLEKMGASDAASVMVGDSLTDLLAAHDANVPSVAVTYGYADGGKDLTMADAIIDRFDQLPSAVDRLLGASA